MERKVMDDVVIKFVNLYFSYEVRCVVMIKVMLM